MQYSIILNLYERITQKNKTKGAKIAYARHEGSTTLGLTTNIIILKLC